ncbi:aromatic-ring hydroxylase C-terminal domain-containing protein [Streptomyces spinoverrucosus]|uniref:aromatic-ring hydroxylase C-terminal domain-containing protein n=1 Tax=Streptomyces spinoverrucosus TaxID=284043 RepID=UPI0035B40226
MFRPGTMEIFRRLGLADRIADVAFPAKFGRIRFRDTLYDRDFATAAADARTRFGVELTDLTEEACYVLAAGARFGHPALPRGRPGLVRSLTGGRRAGRLAVGPRGALLVRPDGHIAARWPDGPRDGRLRHALATLTGVTPD